MQVNVREGWRELLENLRDEEAQTPEKKTNGKKDFEVLRDLDLMLRLV